MGPRRFGLLACSFFVVVVAGARYICVVVHVGVGVGVVDVVVS